MVQSIHKRWYLLLYPIVLRTCLFSFLATLSVSAVANTVTTTNDTEQVLSQPIQYQGYGLHYPQGLSAVKYIYGPQGNWKAYSGIQNVFGYYAGWGGVVPNQRPKGVDVNQIKQLVSYANGTHATSTPDANRHVLFKLLQNSVLNNGMTYTSFHEHNGRGVNGEVRGAPFTQFWFDDNTVARFMSLAYGAPIPQGLYDTGDFNRWQILSLNNANWVPYLAGKHPDLLVLNGLYEISKGNHWDAYINWWRILNVAGTTYDASNQRYSYPGIKQQYHMGLFKILNDKLMESDEFTISQVNTFIQHSISIRSNILSEQQIENGTPIGWITGDGTSRVGSQSLINTETTALNVLALGTSAKYSFEVGRSPLSKEPGFFLRPHNVLSAVTGLSNPKSFMSYGPYMNFPTRNYRVDFYLRSPSPSGKMAYIDVFDSNNQKVLAGRAIYSSQLASGNRWTRFSLPVAITNTNNSLEFRLYWNGTADLDAAAIRLH
jgi:hypothetical protein